MCDIYFEWFRYDNSLVNSLLDRFPTLYVRIPKGLNVFCDDEFLFLNQWIWNGEWHKTICYLNLHRRCQRLVIISQKVECLLVHFPRSIKYGSKCALNDSQSKRS